MYSEKILLIAQKLCLWGGVTSSKINYPDYCICFWFSFQFFSHWSEIVTNWYACTLGIWIGFMFWPASYITAFHLMLIENGWLVYSQFSWFLLQIDLILFCFVLLVSWDRHVDKTLIFLTFAMLFYFLFSLWAS